MKAETMVKAYGLQGMTLDVARLAEPSDLKVLRKVERELASAIMSDKRAYYAENSLDIPEMTHRLANISRSSNYLDYTLSAFEQTCRPRGIIVSFPPGEGFGRWHGSRWTTDERIRFDYAVRSARRDIEQEGDAVRATQLVVYAVGERWERAVFELVQVLAKRVK